MLQPIDKNPKKKAKTGQKVAFFVCRFEPFVGKNKALELPFVGKSRPISLLGGFTLIELVVTLAIVAVLVTWAMPSMREIVQNNRMVALANDMVSDLSLARSEAIKRAATAGVCMSATGTLCDGASWQGGRIVYSTSNGVFTVLRVREPMTSNTLTTVTVPNPLDFNSRGLPIGLGAGATTFYLCDDRGPTKGRAIVISPAGQATTILNPPSC